VAWARSFILYTLYFICSNYFFRLHFDACNMKTLLLVIWIAFGTQTFADYESSKNSTIEYMFVAGTRENLIEKINSVDTGPSFNWMDWDKIQWEIGKIDTEKYEVKHE